MACYEKDKKLQDGGRNGERGFVSQVRSSGVGDAPFGIGWGSLRDPEGGVEVKGGSRCKWEFETDR